MLLRYIILLLRRNSIGFYRDRLSWRRYRNSSVCKPANSCCAFRSPSSRPECTSQISPGTSTAWKLFIALGLRLRALNQEANVSILEPTVRLHTTTHVTTCNRRPSRRLRDHSISGWNDFLVLIFPMDRVMSLQEVPIPMVSGCSGWGQRLFRNFDVPPRKRHMTGETFKRLDIGIWAGW